MFLQLGHQELKKKKKDHSQKENVHQFLINSFQNNQEQNVP